MKTIIIFGAASAIAQATARIWVKEKPTFVLIDKDEAKLKIVADDLKVRGAAATHTIAANLSQTDNHQVLWQQIKSSGQPNTVFIAYGTLGNQQASQADFAVAQQELQTNFLSVVSLLTHIANDFEQQQSGTIAVISSVAGDRGRQSNYIYGSAKGALSILLAGLRNRLTKKGVTVITIKPGFVDTPMTASFKKGLLWVSPETIAAGIVRAVAKKKSVVYLPWFWRYIMVGIKLIPERIFQNLWL